MDNPGEILHLCRLCLVKDEVDVPIFEEQSDIKQIFLKISSCLPVKVSREDRLPKSICSNCSDKLDSFYEFWSSSANAEKTLLSWLDQQDKEALVQKVKLESAKPETVVKKESLVLEETVEESTKDQDVPPPAKRARRTASVVANVSISQEAEDEDLDTPEFVTKVEEECEETEGEDKNPNDTEVSEATEGDDQEAGPSRVNEEGAQAMQIPILFKCRFCDQMVPHLRIHEEIDCISTRYGICLLCGKTFDNLHELSIHLVRIHHRQKRPSIFKCLECEKSYSRRYQLVDHVQAVHRGVVQKFQCETCGKNFSTKSNMKIHNASVHLKDFKVSCEYCAKFFISKSTLNKHIKNKHGDTQETVKHLCPEDGCSRSFKSKSYLTYHIQRKHRDRKELKRCEKCNKIFMYKSNYNKHLRMHRDDFKGYPCTICEKVLTTSQSLKDHTRSHTGEKPFKCDHCESRFLSKKNLMVHSVVHTKERPYGCKICEKRFSQRGSLTVHMKKSHPKLDNPGK